MIMLFSDIPFLKNNYNHETTCFFKRGSARCGTELEKGKMREKKFDFNR